MLKSKINTLQEKILKAIEIYQNICSFIIFDLEKNKASVEKSLFFIKMKLGINSKAIILVNNCPMDAKHI